MKFAIEPGFNDLKMPSTADIKVTESFYPAKLKQARHTHSSASLSFVLSGNYLENVDRQIHFRQPSTLIFHPPEESHSVDYGNESVRILSVQLSCEKLAYLRERSVPVDFATSSRTERVAWLGKRIYQEHKRSDAVSPLAIEGLVLEIFAEETRARISAREKNTPHWLEKTREFLHDNFAESLVLEDVVKVAGVHPVHLARVYRKKYGCTIGEYVRRLRAEYALRQISQTRLPLSQIAHHAGFADQSHLNKIFKNIYNLTPSEYRRISRRS
jgi:AraC family transcriptional regulator